LYPPYTLNQAPEFWHWKQQADVFGAITASAASETSSSSVPATLSGLPFSSCLSIGSPVTTQAAPPKATKAAKKQHHRPRLIELATIRTYLPCTCPPRRP